MVPGLRRKGAADTQVFAHVCPRPGGSHCLPRPTASLAPSSRMQHSPCVSSGMRFTSTSLGTSPPLGELASSRRSAWPW